MRCCATAGNGPTDPLDQDGYYRAAEGPHWDDFAQGLAAIRNVGPGGHYLGHPHTLENFERAVFMPKMFDNNSIEQWQAEGGVEILWAKPSGL
jgi:trimethylamine:corrinoid methyltransferase-like protein